MIYEYGRKSKAKLLTCHPVLAMIADDVLELTPYDITIIHGLRGEDVQNALFDSNVSHKRYPHSRHNKTNDNRVADPYSMSDALDFAPYVDGKIYWNDTHIFALIAGLFIAAAHKRGYTLRYGGDWDSDGKTTDQTLMDWGHIEIIWD
jgi:peptidoglycan L-alanyl-D-glutamate endopeptidase CwlK